ncbi:hypothetical protein HYC85_009865 [Camellia sinensis]|uniref:Uncharacterized protein n=1 Tax=Camellia sinensis TaxID=4442 RepID=A0A7J7HI51_CAMSI|nr:hypothetical protein HYC85_009865 [Camellia sinensis]
MLEIKLDKSIPTWLLLISKSSTFWTTSNSIANTLVLNSALLVSFGRPKYWFGRQPLGPLVENRRKARCHGLPCKANSVTFRSRWCGHLSAQEWPLEVPQRGLTLAPSSPRHVGHQ